MRRLASPEKVLRLLQSGLEARSFHVCEGLSLRAIADGERLRAPIRLVDCDLTCVDISFLHFEAPIRFEACRIASLMATASFFLAGLVIERCVIATRADLSCGGHNRAGHSIVLSETTFTEFVDFSDCWFKGPLQVQRCIFGAGTNLLGNQAQPYRVTFASPPVLDANHGALDVET
jgi:hypothetical protein